MSQPRSARAACGPLVCGTLLFLLANFLHAPQARAQPSSATEALALLDADAGLLVGVRISQLEEMGEFAATSAPEARGSISLATLGASAVLGWSPLQNAGWRESGFALDANLYLQVEALAAKAAKAADRGQGVALWRTRLILPAADPTRARDKLSKIRFRERVSLEDKDTQAFAALLQIGAPKARALKTRLQRAGVFLIAKPTVLPGLLLFTQRQDLFVVDLLRPYGPATAKWKWSQHQDALVQAVLHRPNNLSAAPGAIPALRTAPIGIWLDPVRVADLLVATEVDGVPRGAALRKSPACAGFLAQAQSGHFEALSLRVELAEKAIALQLRWHLRKSSVLPTLFSTHQAPVLAYNAQAFYAQLGLEQLGRLRGQARAPVAQTWDALWRRARRCHPFASTLAMADDWPGIAGLFLEELSALHPQASTLIDNLGALVLASKPVPSGLGLIAEGWIRTPGVAIARAWLRTLFGHEQVDKNGVSWGRGPMRPYALAYDGGDVFGANLLGNAPAELDLGALQSAPRSEGRSTPRSEGRSTPRSEGGASLLELRANPAALQSGRLQHPWGAYLATWTRLSASFILDNDQLRFTMNLDKD